LLKLQEKSSASCKALPENARAGPLRQINDETDQGGDDQSKDNRTAKIELPLPAIGLSHARKQVIPVLFRILWFE
jgi:hypothetical protein